MKKFYYLSNGRSALNYALDNLNLKKIDEILYPEYSCDVLFQHSKKNIYNYKFYKTRNNFFLSLNLLKKEITSNTKIIIVINFFGIKQNIKELYKLCKKKKILLFIDECHTYYDLNKSSDNDCDVKFFSPSKIFNELNNGGILQINNKSIQLNSKLKKKSDYLINFFSKIKKKLKNNPLYENYKFSKKRPLYEDKNYFKSTYNVNNFKLDTHNISLINSLNINKENKNRIKNFKFWILLCKKLKIRPLLNIKDIKHGCPLYFPAECKLYKDSIKLYDFGWKNNIEIISWPTLHFSQKKNKKLINQWKKMIYFPMNKNYFDRRNLL